MGDNKLASGIFGPVSVILLAAAAGAVSIPLLCCGGLAFMSGNRITPRAPAEAKEPDRPEPSPELQAGRQKLIEDLISKGVFNKVESPGIIPKLYVGPVFYSLSIDDKERFVNVVYAFYFDGPQAQRYSNTVVLRDGRTGKQVGTYSPANPGLRLD